MYHDHCTFKQNKYVIFIKLSRILHKLATSNLYKLIYFYYTLNTLWFYELIMV